MMRFPPGYARTLALIHARTASDLMVLAVLRRTPAPPAVGDCDMTPADFVRYARARAGVTRAH